MLVFKLVRLVCSINNKWLAMMIEKHQIKPGNIWNMDEKGFRIGILNRSKRIVPISQLKNECKGQLQDGSTEFVTLIAAVSALGLKMAPTIIFCSESGDIQDKWVESFDYNTQKAFWATSPKGWTSHALGIAWLNRFIQETSSTANYGLQTRLLILDGHGSHSNLEFVTKAVEAGIWVVIFPPHSTHRLQPLDVGIFSPLSGAYSKELNLYTHNSRSFSRVTKGVFWQLFWPAWESSVRKDVVTSGWRKTGIHPINPSIVLDKLKKAPSIEPPIAVEEQPVVRTAREVRSLIKKVYKHPEDHMQYLIRCLGALSVDNEVIMHENRYLQAVILAERKQRKPGRALGLVDSEESKYAKLFSPVKLKASVAALDEKEARIEQEKQRKSYEKALAKDARDIKAQIKRDAIAARKKAAREKREITEHEKIARRRARERERATKMAQKLSKKTSRVLSSNKKEDRESSIVERVDNYVATGITAFGRNGRPIRPPTRF